MPDIEGLQHFKLEHFKDDPSASLITLMDTAGDRFQVHLTQRNLVEFVSALIVSAGQRAAAVTAPSSGAATSIPMPGVIPAGKIGVGRGPSREWVLWFEIGALQLSFAVDQKQLALLCRKALDQMQNPDPERGPQRH
jgi:hypothetical protein